ncbi:MAG TPA: galactokinase family protein [Acidobacteriota bacterium]|jgi:N-acetylgalactosamine kinase
MNTTTRDGIFAADQARISAARKLFLQIYGNEPSGLLRAPARINILGEHVDYVSYIPTASITFANSENDMLLLFRPSGNRSVRGASTLGRCGHFQFELSEGPAAADPAEPIQAWDHYIQSVSTPAPHWGNYVKGAVFFALCRFGERIHNGFDFLVDSRIPAGSGASSSSALTVLSGAAVRRVNEIEEPPEELARDSAKAEWFVGTRGGAMDHITICVADRGQVVHISHGAGTARLLTLPFKSLRWVTFFSHPAVKGREALLHYNERAAVSRIIIPFILRDRMNHRHGFGEKWRAALQQLESNPGGVDRELDRLIDELPESMNWSDMERNHHAVYQECARAFPALVKEGAAKIKVRPRALHHVGEVRRVARAEQLLAGEAHRDQETRPSLGARLREMGKLLKESHLSLRNLYEVSTPEINELVEVLLWDSNVYGARLMGAGFGGVVLAMVDEEHVSSLIDRVQREFYQPRQREAVKENAVMVAAPGVGLTFARI